MKKKFVIDTNVLLHNSNCIFDFEDNDLVLPIEVIDELKF
jgi:PhoH-like ATPase